MLSKVGGMSGSLGPMFMLFVYMLNITQINTRLITIFSKALIECKYTEGLGNSTIDERTK